MTMTVKEKLFEIAQLYHEPDMTSDAHVKLSRMDFLALMALDKAYAGCTPTQYDFGLRCIDEIKQNYAKNPIAFIEQQLGIKNLGSFGDGCSPLNDRLRFYQDFSESLVEASQSFLLSAEEYHYHSKEGEFVSALNKVLQYYEGGCAFFGQSCSIL